MIDVTVILLERALPSTSLAPIEIFSMAGVLWPKLRGEPSAPRFRVSAVSLDGRATQHAIPVGLQPSGGIASVRRTDLIIVPTAEFDPDESLRSNAALLPWLRRWYTRGAAIAGICTGVTLLAETGLLDGRAATTHWAVAEEMRRRYPRVRWQPEHFVTESDRLFCGGGVYAAIDLSLYLVEKYCGHELAIETAKALLLETPRLWQSTYAAAPPRSAHDDEGVQKAQAWLFQNFKREVRLEELAARVGMSPRTFARRFTAATGEAPLTYLHRLRIDAARHLLETKQKSVAEVSLAVGYEDLGFFRRLFKRHTGTAPRAYRARFGARPRAKTDGRALAAVGATRASLPLHPDDCLVPSRSLAWAGHGAYAGLARRLPGDPVLPAQRRSIFRRDRSSGCRYASPSLHDRGRDMSGRVQKFRSVQEMAEAPILVPPGEGFERFARQCARYFSLKPRIYPRGVFRFRSLEEAQAARARVTDENLQSAR